jgi:predicted hydrocarbon binding protein
MRVFGTPGRAIVYDAGIDPGRRSCDRIVKETNNRKEALKLLVHRKAAQNWGRIAIESIDWRTNSGRVSVEDSFEAKGMQVTRPTGEPSCDFFKGYFAGFFSELFQREIAVTEERCGATGDSRCVFTFRPS